MEKFAHYQHDPEIESLYGSPDDKAWELYLETDKTSKKLHLVIAYHLICAAKQLSIEEARRNINKYTLANYEANGGNEYIVGARTSKKHYSEPAEFGYLYGSEAWKSRAPIGKLKEALNTDWAKYVCQEIGIGVDDVQEYLQRLLSDKHDIPNIGGEALQTRKIHMQPLNNILYGPPGTGKTYHTVNRALSILDPQFLESNSKDRSRLKQRFDELMKSGRIGFVTFHQSFSYEDFVEGLRATTNNDGQVCYSVEDGIFKKLCKKRKGSFDEHHQQALSVGEEFGRGYTVIDNTSDLLRLKKPNGSKLCFDWELLDELASYVSTGQLTIDDIREKRVFDRVETNLEKYIVNGYANILPLIVERLITTLPRETIDVVPESVDSMPRVLIIDEINRGNIANIFGELITLIEPSKRAGRDESLEVTLPYSKEKFSVPANLYIIGTMNTADRSIAHIDTALRRRFQFEAMMPDVGVLDDLGIEYIDGVNIAAMLKTINDRIVILYDRDHTLGHSFFVPLRESPNIETLAAIFQNQIFPLLEEYFFEDWGRIRQVLGDNNKNSEELKFYLPAYTDSDFARLLDGELNESLVDKSYVRNPEALLKPTAYTGIYGN